MRKYFVGGVRASYENEIKETPGILPHTGILTTAGALDSGNSIIID